MIFIIDLDETLCRTPEDRDYSKAKPILKNIEQINKLYDKGHEVIIWTGRGSTTHTDWKKITVRQLREWNVKYKRLWIYPDNPKPEYDCWIDDKAIKSERYFD